MDYYLGDFLSESHKVPELGLSTHEYAKVKRAMMGALSIR